MGAVTGIVAGFAAAAGAVALYRYMEKRSRAARRKFKDLARGAGVLDLELDPATGVYRVK
jgi:hypothetical protein